MEKSTERACVYCGRLALGHYRQQPVCVRCVEDYQLLSRETREQAGAIEPTVPRATIPFEEVLRDRQGRDQAKAMLTGGEADVGFMLRLALWKRHREVLLRSRQAGVLRGALIELETLVDGLVAELANADQRQG